MFIAPLFSVLFRHALKNPACLEKQEAICAETAWGNWRTRSTMLYAPIAALLGNAT